MIRRSTGSFSTSSAGTHRLPHADDSALHRRFAGSGRFGWRHALSTSIEAERERWVLWLPVGFGLGIALYFALPSEPPFWTVPLVLPLIAIVAGLVWRQAIAVGRPGPTALLAALSVLLLLGLGAAQWRTHQIDAPTIERRGAYQIEGEVLLVEARVKGDRLVLGDLTIDDLPSKATPARVRFSRRQAEPPLTPGDRIRVRAMLMPPSPPSEPRGFDFARKAFFEQLGAVGYGLGSPVVLDRDTSWAVGKALATLRQALAEHIAGTIPGAAGAVATALLTGLRGAIPDHVWQDMQAAGMAHLLAISGLHLGLVAGTVFFAARIVMALIPPIALRLPTKKLAAAIALIVALIYLLLTGATVPTQRAFIMTALMLLAVMVDRNPFSMRLVAFAAFAVLMTQPESLIGASFQMSFAAVIALIAVYETGVGRAPAGAGGLDWRLLMYVAGVVLATIIASMATAPLAIYHFGRLPTFSILANVLAVPLTAFWIMPAGLIGMILLPLGLGGWCLTLMGVGIELMLAVAAWTAEIPGAVLPVARPPLATLVLTLLGGLWLALWRTGWRRLGLLPIVLGLVLAAIHRQPDLLIDARGMLIAARMDDGLALSPWKKDNWVTRGWLRGAGQAEPAPWPQAGSAPGPKNGQAGPPDLRCDAFGCIYRRNDLQIALTRNAEALPEDCRRNHLVISYPRIETCASGTPLIGPKVLRASGGLALWIGPDHIRQKTVREVRGERPWVR
ncbi:MAG: ComEC family competence protein [Alphaproteobacteria bacterium]|nr:ComEC family competence protein [Alphaproteobacteria bacterium]